MDVRFRRYAHGQTDPQTERQTHRHAHHNNPLPYLDGVITWTHTDTKLKRRTALPGPLQ